MTVATKVARLRNGAALRSDRRSGKKRALAEQTLATLSQLGYARTSLRDIADQSDVSLGILHYYFEDKTDLITTCVRLYKDDFLGQLDAALAVTGPPQAVAAAFVDRLVEAVEKHPETHRLWYDIRGQALFDPSFQSPVEELERAMVDLCGRLLQRLGLQDADALSTYLACDALFRYHLQRRLAGDPSAVTGFRRSLNHLVGTLGAGLA